MRYRISRSRRRAGVRVTLGDRDKTLLRALARFGRAATSDLLRLFFVGVRRDTAMKRLRLLYDGQILEVRSAEVGRESLYELGPEGLRWVDSEGVAVARAPSLRHEHHAVTIREWSRLAAALHGHDVLRLARFEPDAELRGRLAASMGPVIPDAAVEISVTSATGRGVVRVALEIDLTTERRGALERKLSAYDPSAYFTAGAEVGLAVILLGAGQRRRTSIEALVAREWSGWSLVCTDDEWPSTFIERIAAGPLAASPPDKGRLEGASPSGTGAAHEQGESPSR